MSSERRKVPEHALKNSDDLFPPDVLVLVRIGKGALLGFKEGPEEDTSLRCQPVRELRHPEQYGVLPSELVNTLPNTRVEFVRQPDVGATQGLVHDLEAELYRRLLAGVSGTLDVAPNFYPVATRVWRLNSSVCSVARGHGAEPAVSAAPWPRCSMNVSA